MRERDTSDGDADRPTLLMAGSGDPMDAALKLALDRHGIFVESVPLDALRQSVHLTAPDLVMLVGDAAEQGGEAALAALSEEAAAAAVPVVLLAPDTGLESRMRAFRHGAMAVVPRGASPDAIASRVATLARELSDRFEDKTGEIGEATFDELVDLVKKELRSGILSVRSPGTGPLRVVLGAGRPVAQAVEEFVARLKPHVSTADALSYQFHASAGGAPVEVLDLAGAAAPGGLEQLRVLLVDDDPARADMLAQELRARQAMVFVTDTEGRGLTRAEGLDPQVALIAASGLEGQGFEVVRTIRKHLRLRWTSILVAPWEDIWPSGAAMPDFEKLAARMEPLLGPERDLAARARAGEPFDARLEATGPSRMLRTLVATGETIHVTVRNPRAVVEVDVAQGLLVGASATTSSGTETLGTSALAVLLALGSGRAHVERRSHPALANVMAPAEEALAVASQESVELPASIPPEAVSRPPPLAPARPSQPEVTRAADAAEEITTLRPPAPPVDPSSAVRTPVPPAPEAAAGPRLRRPSSDRRIAAVAAEPAAKPSAPEAPRPLRLDSPSPSASAVAPRRARAPRIIARIAVTSSAVVLLAVLALIAYRYSDLRHPEADRLLAWLGAPREAVEPEPERRGPDPVDPVEPREPTEPAPEPTEPTEPAPDPAEEEVVRGSNVPRLLERASAAGRSPLAERIYRRVLEIDPREHHAMLGLAAILRDRGEHAEAVVLLRRAVQRRPRRASYRVLLGDALVASGDAVGGRVQWERALELEPDNAAALDRLGP